MRTRSGALVGERASIEGALAGWEGLGRRTAGAAHWHCAGVRTFAGSVHGRAGMRARLLVPFIDGRACARVYSRRSSVDGGQGTPASIRGVPARPACDESM